MLRYVRSTAVVIVGRRSIFGAAFPRCLAGTGQTSTHASPVLPLPIDLVADLLPDAIRALVRRPRLGAARASARVAGEGAGTGARRC